MTTNIETLLGSPFEMLKTIFSFLEENGFSRNLFCDHICYRVETMNRYESLKKQLQQISTFFHESQVNGRPISIFKLINPLKYQGHSIECLELPSPKPSSPYSEAWQHAEFVVNESLDTFFDKHSGLDFDLRAYSKKINRELILKVSDNYQIKFHEKHILKVISEDVLNLSGRHEGT